MSSILKTISFGNVINAPCATITLNYNAIAYDTNSSLPPNRHLNRSPEFFKQDAQHKVPMWSERVVHCVYDNNDKNTKALASNDRSPEQNIISETICDVGGRPIICSMALACSSHDRLRCHLADMSAK